MSSSGSESDASYEPPKTKPEKKPKKEKKKRESSSASESDSDSEPKPKQSKKEKKSEKKENGNTVTNDRGEVLHELGKMKYANVSNFKGRMMINIREYYTDEGGEMKPGRKGICLMADQWKKLKEIIPDLDKKMT